MQGAIEMEVTHETIVQAVQMLFDQQFAAGKAPKVQTVEMERTSPSYNSAILFVVKASAPEAASA